MMGAQERHRSEETVRRCFQPSPRACEPRAVLAKDSGFCDPDRLPTCVFIGQPATAKQPCMLMLCVVSRVVTEKHPVLPKNKTHLTIYLAPQGTAEVVALSH